MESKWFINNEIRLPFEFTSPCSTTVHPGKFHAVLMTSTSYTFLFYSNPQEKELAMWVRDETGVDTALILG